MSVYMTEEEQLAAIKKWWNKYSNLITITLAVIFLCIAGYKYWNWHQEKISAQASAAYEQLMLAFSNQDSKGIQAYANQLTHEYSQTVYADAARLSLAKLFVSEEHYDKAREILEAVIKHTKMSSLRQIAKIRIARLYAAEKKYDKALAQLDPVEDMTYNPVINELKGDIYAATGQYPQAITAYKEAIIGGRTSGVGNLFLEMKTNELTALAKA